MITFCLGLYIGTWVTVITAIVMLIVLGKLLEMMKESK